MDTSTESTEEVAAREPLDAAVHPPDYVSRLFAELDWGSRVRPESRARLGGRFLGGDSWDTHSYTMDYLH